MVFFVPIVTYSQNVRTTNLIRSIEGKWHLDSNGNITYTRIVELLGVKSNVIFDKLLNYFIFHYNFTKSTIVLQDRANGIIVGKGCYHRAYTDVRNIYINAYHIIKVEIKDFKIRISLTLTEYEVINNSDSTHSIIYHNINSMYPFNESSEWPNDFGRAFYISHNKSLERLDHLEKYIKTTQLENNDW